MQPEPRRSYSDLKISATNLRNVLHCDRETQGRNGPSSLLSQALQEGEYPGPEETGPWGISWQLSGVQESQSGVQVRNEKGELYNQYREHRGVNKKGTKRKSLHRSEDYSEGGENNGSDGGVRKKSKECEGPLFNGGQNKGQFEGPEETPDNGPISPRFIPMGSGVERRPYFSDLWCNEHWEDPISESTSSESSLPESLGSPEDVRP